MAIGRRLCATCGNVVKQIGKAEDGRSIYLCFQCEKLIVQGNGDVETYDIKTVFLVFIVNKHAANTISLVVEDLKAVLTQVA